VLFVESEGSSVDSDDITGSLDDGEIFKFLSIENNGSKFFAVERWINDLD